MSQTDYTAAASNGQPKSLAALINSGMGCTRLWRPEELAAIFRHQLSAPVLLDLGGFDPSSAGRLKTLGEAQGLILKSFSELFHHPSPPIELLSLTKEFAKANMDHPESTIPGEVAAALYYTSIAVALVKLGTRISTLKDTDLERGLVWAGDQPWIDRETKTLLAQSLNWISSGAGKTPSTP